MGRQQDAYVQALITALRAIKASQASEDASLVDDLGEAPAIVAGFEALRYLLDNPASLPAVEKTIAEDMSYPLLLADLLRFSDGVPGLASSFRQHADYGPLMNAVESVQDSWDGRNERQGNIRPKLERRLSPVGLDRLACQLIYRSADGTDLVWVRVDVACAFPHLSAAAYAEIDGTVTFGGRLE